MDLFVYMVIALIVLSTVMGVLLAVLFGLEWWRCRQRHTAQRPHRPVSTR